MSNNLPLVSIIMPCYNAEKFLSKSIDSILKQTYHNFELLCINDCSTDATPEILKEYESLDKRVKVYTNKKNLKIAETLNVGLKHSNGKYIARMDADDISLPNRIELQVKFLEEKESIGICGGQCKVINEFDVCSGKLSYILDNYGIISNLLFDSSFAHPTVMFRRNIYESLGGYKDMMPIEDLEYWHRMAKAKIKMANLPDVLLLYRIHGNNISKTHNDERKISLIKCLYSEYPEFYYSVDDCMKYNMRFLLGNWGGKTNKEQMSTIKQVSDNLYDYLTHNNLFSPKILKETIDYYKTRAYLSCCKSNQNSLYIKFYSFLRLLLSFKTTIKTLYKLYK